jgi:hypothetical protein
MEFYIIFHSSLFKKNYETFTHEECLRMLRWVAVNEAIPKKIPDWIMTECLLKEYTLPVYDPLMQMCNYYQNSFFFHLNRNRQYATKQYVGFGQYDMSLPAESFRQAESIINKGVPTLFFMYPYQFDALYSNPLNETEWRELVNLYNTYAHKSHTFENVKSIPLFLCHTFILPTNLFFECMDFVECSIPFCLRKLGWNTRHLAGTFERVIALSLSFKILEGKIKNLVHLKGVEHLSSQHTADEFRGLKEGLNS